VRIDQMQPAAPESAFFRAEGPHAPIEGVEFAFGLGLEYAKGPLKVAGINASGGEDFRTTLVDQAVLARLGASLTPLHWLTLDLSVPFALVESGSTPTAKGYDPIPAPSAPGLGDLRVGALVRPIDTKPFGLILGVRFWAPIGSEDAYLSDKTPHVELDLGVAGEASKVLWGCTGYASPLFFATHAGERVGAACALHVKPAASVSFGVEPTFSVLTSVPKPDQTTYSMLFEPLGALRLYFGGVRVGLAAGPGFGGAPGTAELRGLLSLGYVGGGKAEKAAPPPPPDSDLDKIPDAEDACPNEAGPDNKDPKKRGCPTVDRDGDGIPDDDDYCPDRPGIKHDDPKANGCPDTDNDGLPDPIDTCKNEPGPAPTGCPKHARLGGEGFKVTPPLEFAARSSTLTPDARAALEEIAATMRANPKIEQVSVWLGTKGAKADLSDKRAQEIILVFRAGTLDSARYELVLKDDLRGGVVQFHLVK
jgi:hypothetical protein